MSVTEKNSFKLVALLVIGLHLLLIGYAIYFIPEATAIKQKPKLIVQTVNLKEKPLSQPIQTVKKEIPIPAPKLEEKPAPLPEKKIEPVKPQEIAKSKKAAPKPEAKKVPIADRKADLIAKAKASFNKVDTAPKKNSPEPFQKISLQTESITISSPGFLSEKETSYRNELAARLKLLITLPDKGQINMRLTLNREGKVADVEILSSEGPNNANYLKKALPKLQMPPFGNLFANKEQYSFTITLKGE